MFSGASYGSFLPAIDIARFVEPDEFLEEMDRSIAFVQNLPPLPGYDRYDFPGGQEFDRLPSWSEEGIPLSDYHRLSLENIASELGLACPW